MTSRSTCFTSFATTAPDAGTGINYLVFQREMCPKTQRLHWQGYAQHKVMRRSAFQAAIGDTKAHCEAPKGTAKQARDYCMKKDTRVPDTEPQEFGEFVTQGKSLALARAVKQVNEGKWRDVDDGIWMRHSRGLQAVIDKNYIPPIKRTMNVRVVWGASGCGKTTRSLIEARKIDPYACVISWYKPKDGAGSNSGDAGRARFDPYKGQTAIVIDEFSRDQIAVEEFLSMTGGAPMTARIIGGVCDWKVTDIWITSNDPPESWFREGLSRRVSRRITSTTFVEDEWTPGGDDDIDKGKVEIPAALTEAEAEAIEEFFASAA